MLASSGDVVSRWKFLNNLYVGNQPGSSEDPLEEIVTEERVLGDSTLESRFEGGHIVDPLSGVRTFVE